MQTIYLDISNRGVIPAIYAKQGDVGRKVEVVLTNSGLPYEPEAGSAFSAWYSGASGMGNYTDIGGKSAFAVSGNKVTVELITQMLQNGGEGFLCLVLSRANGEQIGLWNIPYICEAVPGAGSEAAQQYYTAFSEAVAGLPYPDVSLSAPGKAADAAAVGTALAGKAPAGYGLGSYYPKDVSGQDLNSCTKGGFYSWEYATNAPFWWGYMIVIPGHAGEGITQIAYCLQGDIVGSSVQRTRHSWSTWSEWDWVNPPMKLGVEYRTTERWNGKPVYTMLINCGTMPTAGSTIRTDMPSNIYGTIDKVIRCRGADSSGNTIPFSWEGEYRTEVSASRAAIFIYAKDDYSGNTADVTIWYTKY